MGKAVVAIDITEHRLTKAQVAQCHTSQHPPFLGSLEKAAARMVCHEYFTLAYPPVDEAIYSNLFALVQPARVDAE